ncbi:MAG: hypothetical protein SWE60_05840 [Thermodesulfobacteriota bacterium]|nr:hypothetical protein [Thermodesulfobacteriota bacterium]
MSKLNPVLWNTVILGNWNPAILTPKGIAKHIFDLPDETPFEVLVPVNAMGQPKVKINGFLVSADFDKLVIDCEKHDWDSLEKSRDYCIGAMNSLPVTPVSAAGFNIRYEMEDPSEDFMELLRPQLDARISDNHLKMVARQIRRSIAWNDGNINLHMTRQEGENYRILLNFHKKSNDRNVIEKWLSTPIEEARKIAQTLICSILELCEEGEI